MLARKRGVSRDMINRWKANYGGMDLKRRKRRGGSNGGPSGPAVDQYYSGKASVLLYWR